VSLSCPARLQTLTGSVCRRVRFACASAPGKPESSTIASEQKKPVKTAGKTGQFVVILSIFFKILVFKAIMTIGVIVKKKLIVCYV